MECTGSVYVPVEMLIALKDILSGKELLKRAGVAECRRCIKQLGFGLSRRYTTSYALDAVSQAEC
jgi:hypothetical protein